MTTLYETINSIFDPEMNSYLTDKAIDLVEKTMREMIERTIGNTELDTIDKFFKDNYLNPELQEVGGKVARLSAKCLGSGVIIQPHIIHPVLFIEAMGGARLVCGVHYYLKNNNYDLDKVHKSMRGLVFDKGLIDYLKDVNESMFF